MNWFNAIGQQISNFGIGMKIIQLWPNKPDHLVGISCIFAYIAGIACFFIIVSEARAVFSDERVQDSGPEDSDQPASLEASFINFKYLIKISSSIENFVIFEW